MPDSERSSHLNLVPELESEGEAAAPAPAEPKRRGPGRPKKNTAAAAPEEKRRPGRPKKNTARRPAVRTSRKKKVAPQAVKKAKLVRVRSTELRQKAAGGDVDAIGAMRKIQSAHRRWTSSLERKGRVGQECGQRLKAAEAAFVNAIEAPLDVTRVEQQAYKGKLENVETRWGEWSEAKAQNIEEKKEVRDAVKAALEALNDAIEESRQPRLPGVD